MKQLLLPEINKNNNNKISNCSDPIVKVQRIKGYIVVVNMADGV